MMLEKHQLQEHREHQLSMGATGGRESSKMHAAAQTEKGHASHVEPTHLLTLFMFLTAWLLWCLLLAEIYSSLKTCLTDNFFPQQDQGLLIFTLLYFFQKKLAKTLVFFLIQDLRSALYFSLILYLKQSCVAQETRCIELLS